MQLSFFKTCVRCKKNKFFTEFVADKRRKDGRYYYCKECVENYRQANYEKWQESHKKTNEKYKDKYTAQMKEYAKNNKERTSLLGKLWRQKNAAIIREQDKKKQQDQTYKDRHYAYNQKYLQNHPEKRKQFKANRRARETGAGSFTSQEWLELCDFYGNICLCCKEAKPLTVDHVIPLSKSGSNTIDNLQPLCLDCNRKKQAKVIDYRK